MRLTRKLGEMIATYMSAPGHVLELDSDSEFVISGLRAASAANPITRSKILSDVSEVLSCKSEDLEFLFTDYKISATPSASYEVMVPDFQSQLLAVAE